MTAPFPIRQDRSQISLSDRIDLNTLVKDIQGYAVFSALSDYLVAQRAKRQTEGEYVLPVEILDLEESVIQELLQVVEKYLSERLAAWEMNRLRIISLSRIVEGMVREGSGIESAHFWNLDPAFSGERETLRRFSVRMRSLFEDDASSLKDHVLTFDRADLRHFFSHIQSDITAYRERVIP